MLTRDPSRSRPPGDRPLDIVALELLLTISQALLAGILLSLASDLGGDSRAPGLPIPGLTAILGLAVGAAWIWWLAGGSGWPMAALDLAVALLVGALWLLSLQDASAPRIDPLQGLVGFLCAIAGIVAGVFLPGPRRVHWKGGVSQPRRGLPVTRSTPAPFSPAVQKVFDERLSRMTMPRLALPARRTAGASAVADANGDEDGPAVADLVSVRTTPAADRPAADTTPAGSTTGPGPEPVEGHGDDTPGAPGSQPIAIDDTAPDETHASEPGEAPAPASGGTADEPEPLSVAAMRLAQSGTSGGITDDDDDDDETLPFTTPHEEATARDTGAPPPAP